MKIENWETGEEVEIPTLQVCDSEEDEHYRVDTLVDMELLVKNQMGFDSVADFDEQCETPAAQLLGKFFTIAGKAHGHFDKQPVFIKEGEVELATGKNSEQFGIPQMKDVN